jgi:hypothetical protein
MINGRLFLFNVSRAVLGRGTHRFPSFLPVPVSVRAKATPQRPLLDISITKYADFVEHELARGIPILTGCRKQNKSRQFQTKCSRNLCYCTYHYLSPTNTGQPGSCLYEETTAEQLQPLLGRVCWRFHQTQFSATAP